MQDVVEMSMTTFRLNLMLSMEERVLIEFVLIFEQCVAALNI